MKKILLSMLLIIGSNLNAEVLSEVGSMECLDIYHNSNYSFQRAEGQYFGYVTKEGNTDNKLFLILKGEDSSEGFEQLLFMTKADRLPAELGADYWAQKMKSAELIKDGQSTIALLLFDNEDGNASEGNIVLNCFPNKRD